jgi:methyl-accepting chemotaxis protein
MLDSDSIALADSTGTLIASSNSKDIGSAVPQRDYFQSAMQGNTFITGVSISTITNAPAIFHSAPIKNASGKVVGIIRSRSSLDLVLQTVQRASSRVGNGAAGILLDQDGLVIANTFDEKWLLRPIAPLKPEINAAMVKDKRWGNNAQPEPIGLTGLVAALNIQRAQDFDWRYQNHDYQIAALPMSTTRWSYVAALPTRTAQAAANNYLQTTGIIALGALACAFAVAFLGSRNVTQPMVAMSKTAMQLAEGDVAAEFILSRQQRAMVERGEKSARDGAAQVMRVFEDALARGALTEAQLFDRNYQPIPNTHPQKYHTAFDSFTDANIRALQDAFLHDPAVTFAVTVDVNGYLPTHNARFSHALTGDQKIDLTGNRSKRIFNDPVGIAAARNTEPILHQLYRRDTGELMWDISAPIRVRGQAWGAFRIGLALNIANEIDRLVFTFQHLGNYLRGMARTANRLAEGEVNFDLPVRSNKDALGNAMLMLKTNIGAVTSEARMLTHAAVEGKLATRGDAAKFRGGYRDIVQGVNDTLDAVIGPLNVAAEYVDRISKGDTPPKITDEYRGDFNAIKNNLNQCIEQIGALVDQVGIVINAARDGDLSTRANAERTGGVYRKILRGLNDTMDAVIAPIADTKQILAEIARGDLTIQMNGHYQGDYATLKESIEAMVGGLKQMALQTKQGATRMSTTTTQILASSTQMASTTREQASAVNQVTSTVKEIKASAEQVAQRAQSVAEQAMRASQAAQRGTEAVTGAMQGMDDIRGKVEAIAENILALSEQTQQIGEIIDTVTDIAGQSNILALNAAIEAAQAGEAGKGFRVVADEVRSLAEQSRQAAAQVKNILGDIQRATNQAVMATEQGTKGVQSGSDQVNRTAQTIQELAQVVEQSAQAAQQIVAGVEQQTIGLDQIAIGMNDINQAAQQSAAGATQSQKAAQDMNELAEQLKQVVAVYRM